ncbi:MAG: MFS transporter, partial [Clostridia bacterium]
SMLGFDVIMTVYMFYVSDTLGFGGGVTAMIFVAIPLVCAMLSAPFWTWLSEKKSKTFAYCVSAICATVSFFMTMFIPVGNGVMLGIVAGLGGLSMSAIQIIPWAVIPDVVDIDEYKNGVRREGAIFGLTSFLYKLANGVAIAIVGVVLGAFGYVEGAGSYIDVVEGFQQPESALLAIRILISCLPGTIFLLSLIFSRKSDFNRSRMAEIHAELDRRREQKETSVTVEQTEKISE